jgi:hypothetical protein
MRAIEKPPVSNVSELEKKIRELVTNELRILWIAQHNVGLKGYMSLYTNAEQIPFRTQEAGLTFWFGPDDSQDVVDEILKYYNDSRLPNSPLLLNPIVHQKEKDGSYTPIGSAVVWCCSFSLGIDILEETPAERIASLGVFTSTFERGGDSRAGLKIVGFCDTIQPPEEDGKTVEACAKLYEIANIKSDKYAKYYLLSGIGYLTNNGMFEHPDIKNIFPKKADLNEKFIKEHTVSSKKIFDASKCWNAYEHIHSLYIKFGTDTSKIEKNLRFFNLVARDITLFDATGPMKIETKEGDENSFKFIVPSIIPRGSVILLAASSGVGRSSTVHRLCAIASTDYEAGAEPPKWLDQPLNIEQCHGINIYFSGEDVPQIFNARAKVIDPESMAMRLMYQHTYFGENISFAQHLRNLRKIPDVPLLIIDTSRKYLNGDENDNNIVNAFFDALEDFAIEKNAAVIVVHPLKRGLTPKSTSQILDLIEGAEAFVNRPRIIMGMYREGDNTVIGLAKSNLPPNLGMMTGERIFARNEKDLSLTLLPGEAGKRKIIT